MASEDNNKPNKRRNRFDSKVDITREIIDTATRENIDRLEKLSEETGKAVLMIKESVDILAEKKITVNTETYERISNNFI